MDPRHAAAAGFAALALVATGCGGGDDSKDQGGALSKQDYIAQADRICRESNQKILAVKAPTSATEVVSYVQKALPEIDAALVKLKALEPAADKRDVPALTRVTSQGTRIARTTEAKAKAAGFKTCGIQQASG